jgi:hypothetical protein
MCFYCHVQSTLKRVDDVIDLTSFQHPKPSWTSQGSDFDHRARSSVLGPRSSVLGIICWLRDPRPSVHSSSSFFLLLVLLGVADLTVRGSRDLQTNIGIRIRKAAATAAGLRFERATVGGCDRSPRVSYQSLQVWRSCVRPTRRPFYTVCVPCDN